MLSTVESIVQYLGVSLTSQQVQPVAEARQTDTLRQQHLVVGNNSFSGNFNYEHLMNITRVGYPYEESYLPDPAKAWD